MRRIAAFIANMISAGGCASAGFAEAGALVPPTSVGGAPLNVTPYTNAPASRATAAIRRITKDFNYESYHLYLAYNIKIPAILARLKLIPLFYLDNKSL